MSEKHPTILHITLKKVLLFPKNIPVLSFICLISLKGILWLSIGCPIKSFKNL